MSRSVNEYNTVDNIQTCKNNGKTGALISLDIRKAFDTISHNFLNKAYRFFNFGENIIRWLNIIGTKRRGCIIVENDMYTKFFDLKRGTAQGDTISPYIFISVIKFCCLNLILICR